MKVLLIPMGSMGDVYPLVGLGAALVSRGHRVEVIANSYYQSVIEKAGLSFVELGTYEDLRTGMDNPDLWHRRKGFLVLAQAILPLMRPLYEIIADHYVPGETILVASSLALAARVAQEHLGVPLVTAHLQPTVFRSAYEGSEFLPWPFSHRWLRVPGKRLLDWLLDVLILDPVMGREINVLRGRLGLPRIRRPLYRWLHSPQLVLGLFPEWFASPQPDWPQQTRLTGFPLYDDSAQQEMPKEIEAFLAGGTPPIVFTPGSAMKHARQFFAESVTTCRLLGRRGLLLTRFPEQVPDNLPEGIRHFDYLPLSRVLPRAAALVSHGGIGTVSQALAAGIPQLLMPMAFDQFPNAARLVRLGVARSLTAKAYTAPVVTRTLGDLLTSEEVVNRCQAIAKWFHSAEDPLEKACLILEEFAEQQLPRSGCLDSRAIAKGILSPRAKATRAHLGE
ncbi:MAG TPA: nucleotide disphospho-sugar-binding domain-containing protein [Gemmataceae bacterium]|nr:nucleotide disphospho-sugar-binding domain-containing protein [Gemmataceae bacterium]